MKNKFLKTIFIINLIALNIIAQEVEGVSLGRQFQEFSFTIKSNESVHIRLAAKIQVSNDTIKEDISVMGYLREAFPPKGNQSRSRVMVGSDIQLAQLEGQSTTTDKTIEVESKAFLIKGVKLSKYNKTNNIVLVIPKPFFPKISKVE